MENILEVTRFAFQGDAMQRLSSVLHESQSATRQGIEAAVPASLAGLAAHALSEQKAADLLGAFRGGDYPHADASEVTKMVDDPAATARLAESGQGFLRGVFGGRLGGMVDALAGQTGVSRASASTLLGLSAPLVLSAISKEAESRHLDAHGLSRFLADQGRRASGVLPASMTNMLNEMPGFGALGRGGEGAAGRVREVGATVVGRTEEAFGRARDRAENVVGEASRRAHGAYEDVTHRMGGPGEHERRNWGWLLAGLAVLAFLAFLIFRPRQANLSAPPLNVPSLPTPKLPEIPKIQSPSLPAMPKAETPEMKQPARAMQAPETLTPSTGAAAFATYLSGSEATPRRFILQGIEFASGSSAITPNSTLDGVAQALKEHPTAKLRVEGHTDATGSAQGNQALSLSRAESVKNYLTERGVDATRMEAVGRSTEEPIVATSGANQENRRVDLVVLQH